MYPVPEDGKEKSTLSLTIALTDKSLTQKVQDYLVTTNPKGSITPMPSFSTDKQKQLQDQARDAAIADARKRAESTAKGLDAKLGKVQTIGEGQLGGGVYPMMTDTKTMSALETGTTTSASPTLTVQPGEDEYTYSIDVTFYLR